jgi:molybdate transport system substrate-binding protein
MPAGARQPKALRAEPTGIQWQVASPYVAWYITAVTTFGHRLGDILIAASRLFLLLLVVAIGPAAYAAEPSRVFAAASLTNALTDIGALWQQAGHPAPVLDFAASSTLAKQIEAGAPADLFASADVPWMDELAAHGLLAPGTRIDLLGNDLVLIAPKGRAFKVSMAAGFKFGDSFSGKLCTGEPGVVPVGRYAQQSLQALGWWEALQGRIVGTDDVRAALAFVEQGECASGIVYATDAAISSKVEVIAVFPAATHQPIVYPFALLKGAGPESQALLEFLKNSPAAAGIFRHYGFTRQAP